MLPIVRAVEHIRRMRGGSQSQLMRCSDGQHYVVKFQNTPQGVRTLANEVLATLLAERLGLPVAPMRAVEVGEALISGADEMAIELPRGRLRLRPGLCCGSMYPRDPDALSGLATVCDFLPAELLPRVVNLRDFFGMLVFDKWADNVDARQAVFVRTGLGAYRAVMIDHGLCFGGARWGFPDALRDGFHSSLAVYGAVRGLDAFEPWLDRLETTVNSRIIWQVAQTIPPEWYGDDASALSRLLETLDRRRKAVRDLVRGACLALPRLFPNWTHGAERRKLVRAVTPLRRPGSAA